MAEVLAGACVGEGIGTFSVKAQRIIQLAIGEQPIRGDRGAAQLEHQTVVEAEPQRALSASPRYVRRCCPVRSR